MSTTDWGFLAITLAFVAVYGDLALRAWGMRQELKRRDAEGCRHGFGPDGKRRDIAQ